MEIKFKDGTLIGLFTEHTISKPCPTCTYGMTVIREIIFRIKQATVKDYKLEKESEYQDNWEKYDYGEGANFVGIVSFFNKDFSEITVDEFIKSFCEEVGFKTVSIVNDVY